MAESQWGEEVGEQTVTAKGGIPMWVWGCGGGCLVMLILMVVAGGLLWTRVKEFTDPEKARAKAELVLVPRGEWPLEVEVVGGGGMLGQAQYHMRSSDDVWYAILFDYSKSQAAAAEQLLDPESQANTGLFGVGEIRDAEACTVMVQGVETKGLRFFPWVPGGGKAEGEVGPSLRVDLTRVGGDARVLQLTRTDSEEPVKDEELERFLAPFDVWGTGSPAETPDEIAPLPAPEEPVEEPVGE